jgi:MFS family permease
MFLCGLTPVIVALIVLMRVKEPERWQKHSSEAPRHNPLKEIFNATYRKRTLVNAALLTVAIIGLWAGAVYEPTAIITLAKKAGMVQADAVKTASIGTAILSIGTILGCLCVPLIAERIGRKKTLALYFAGMFIMIAATFGWVFYMNDALYPFIGMLFFLGFFGGNFAVFSLWLPEQYATNVRATAFAFSTSIGRLIGAVVNFGIGAMVVSWGSLGTPVAITSLAFLLGLVIIPLAMETKGQRLPE